MKRRFPEGDETPRVVVITGGSSGIGRCTAGVFAQRGWRVGLIARGEQGLAASRRDVEAAGARGATAQADVADSKALGIAADAIVAALGPIDVWINCAGNGVYGRLEDVSEREFQRVTDVTYHGTVNGTRLALSHMRKRGHGSIVNVCSGIAFHGLPLMSSYAGAKAAVRAFGQAIRGELRLEGSLVRLSTVFPPAANTPYFSHAISHMGWPARPARPIYQPEVVAQGIWQAMTNGRAEMAISGTVVAFSLATRIAPRLMGWCVGQMGFERQLTRDPGACALQEPNLFEPARRVFTVHGPFGRRAREWSAQLWLESRLSRATRLLNRVWQGARSNAPSPATRAPARPDPELVGLAVRPDDL
jgi:short-subunit dehydrogenase